MEQQSPLITQKLMSDYSTQPIVTSQQTTFPSFNERIPIRVFRQNDLNKDLPIVLVLHDKQTTSNEIDKFCQHLAQAGYLVLAPDLFYRHHETPISSDIKTFSEEQVSKVKDSLVMSYLDRCAHWALSQGGRARSLAVIGFGWGGRMSWLYCAHTPQLKAAVSCDPILNNALTLAQPMSPIDQLNRLQAPLLILTANEHLSIGCDDDERPWPLQANSFLDELNRMSATEQPLLEAIQPELAGTVPMRLLPKIMAFLKRYNPAIDH